MASEERKMPHRGRALRVPLLALAAAAALLLAVFATGASAEVVYDNPPAAGAEPSSVGFEETATAELGSLLRFAGSARLDPTVRVAVANAGEPVSVPITLSVHGVDPDQEPGLLLATETRTFELAAGPGVQTVAFGFTGVTLPAEAIVSVAFAAESVGVVVAGPPAVGANPREAEGVYRAGAEAATTALAFAPDPLAWQGRQPAFTVEANAPAAAPVPAVVAPATAATPLVPHVFRHEYTVPASKRMTVSFPRASARIGGPGALIQVRCTGSSAARCIGTIALSAAGVVHKAPFSISKGRRQYIVVPLGSDLDRLDGSGAARGTATASTIQVGGAAVRTKRALKLK